MWEALGLLLLVLWQEQGGGWAQICSPADAAGCHTQQAHTRSPLTQTLHKYRHRVALILHTQMPNTSRTLFSAGNGNTACLSKLNTSQLPVIASSLISGKSLKTCSAMRSVCCEVTWHLWAGEDDVVYLESLLCGGEVVSAGEGDQKKPKHKYFGNLWQSWQFMFSANPDLHSDFQTFFFSVNWETLKIILIVVETPQAK